MEIQLYNAATKGDVSFLYEARNKEIESGSDEYFLKQTSHKNNILHLAVRQQRFEFIKVVLSGLLLSTKAIDTLINQKNDDGNTPVHVAAEVGKMNVFELLYDYVYVQTDVHEKEKEKEKEKVIWMQNEEGNMPLHVALINGNIEVAKLLVEKHPDMTRSKNLFEETPLHLATIHQPIDKNVPINEREAKAKAYLAIIKTLLEKESSVACWCDAKGSTPLHRAASITSAYNAQIIRLILGHCPYSAELRDGSRKTVLHLLKTIPSYNEGKDLLGVTVIRDLKDDRDKEGNTPLHTAAMNMNLNMVRVLVDSSANQSIRNNDGISAASLIQDHFEETMEKNQMTMEVCEATDKANVSILRERLHNFGNSFLLLRDSNRRNVLHKLMHINEGTVIIKDDFVDFIKQVLESFPTFMGQVDINGDTPLHILMRNSPDTTILYENEISTFESDLVWMLLDICCKYFHKAEEEADEKEVCYYNRPWLMQNLEGNTPLHEALIANHGVIGMRKIFELNINITAKLKNKRNETPLHLAADISNSSVDEHEVGTLVKELAIANDKAALTYDKNGLTPLLRAAQRGNVNTIGILDRFFPEAILLTDEKKGQTLWHLLVSHSQPYTTFDLLKNHYHLRKNIRQKDYEGNTALHLAIQGKQFAHAINILQDSDTEEMKNLLDVQNAAGQTPSDFIRSLPQIPDEIQEILEKNGLVVGIRSVWDVSTSQIREYADSMCVVAALITTITFTAAFTVPGGLVQEKGVPLLIRGAAFQAFMISNILAMCLSMMVIFCLLWVVATTDQRKSVVLMDFSLLLLLLSLYATLVSFMMGVYATTIHDNPWIAIITIILCSLLMLLMHKNLVMDILVPAVKKGLILYGSVRLRCLYLMGFL